MRVDRLINVLAEITLIEMMVTIGLGVIFSDVLRVSRNYVRVARAVLANYILVPAAALGLLLLFHASPHGAVGFLVAAVCPGAPYGPPFTAMAKENVAVSVGLMVILAGSSAIVAALLLQLLLPHSGGRHPAENQRDQDRRHTARGAVGRNAFVQFRTLAEIRLLGCVGIVVPGDRHHDLRVAAGGRESENRKGMVLTTSVRNVGVGLIIVTGGFPGTPPLPRPTAYAVFQTIVMRWLSWRGADLRQQASG